MQIESELVKPSGAAPSQTPGGMKEATRRYPPINMAAEEELLAAILMTDGEALERAGDKLTPEHFADPAHGRIFRACQALAEKGRAANPVTLRHWFEADGQLSEIGGVEYLSYLMGRYTGAVHSGQYAGLIADLHMRRRLIAIGEEMVAEAFHQDLEVDAPEQIERAEKKLFDLAQIGEVDRGAVILSDALRQAQEMAQRAKKLGAGISGKTTGLRTLDKLLGGLHDSDLVVVAGRPGMGKTALAVNIAVAAAKACAEEREEGAGVAFFSLEMSAEQLATRLIAEHSGIPSDRIRRGAVEDEDFEKFVTVSEALGRYPLYIDDTPGLSVAALRARARRLARKRNFQLGLIVVDYLQLMRSSPGGRSENRVLEIGEITRSLKIIAKELNIPVVALSQLSRQVESRADKRPLLSDLRESGTIEQDADVVMFIYREEYYLRNSEPRESSYEGDGEFSKARLNWESRRDKAANKAEILISKQRHGPTGSVELYFNDRLTSFHDLDPHAER